jgi:hypothetical protein
VTDTGSPDAVDDTATIPEGTTTVTTIDAIGSGDVLTDNATYESNSLDTTGTTGTVTDNDDGTFGYVPAPTFSGTDTFTYTICDDDNPASPTSCDTATVTITVTAGTPDVVADTNRTPVIEARTVDGAVGQPLAPLSGRDPDGDSITFILVGGSLPRGTILNPDGTFGGSPDEPGSTTAIVQVCDPHGACSVGSVTVNISSVDPLLPSTGAEIRMNLTRSFIVLALGVLLIVGSRRRRHRVL